MIILFQKITFNKLYFMLTKCYLPQTVEFLKISSGLSKLRTEIYKFLIAIIFKTRESSYINL